MGEFESREAAEIVEVNERMFRYWATSRAFIPEEDAVGRQGVRRRYSFKNIVEAAIIRDLISLHVSVNLAGKAIGRLHDEEFMRKEFCFLIIAADGAIEVFSEDDFPNENEAKLARMAFGGADQVIPTRLIEEVLATTANSTQVAFILQITRRAFSKSSIVIPVHRIRAEMKRKVASR